MRCPLTGEACTKTVRVTENAFFLAQPKHPEVTATWLDDVIKISLPDNYTVCSTIEEQQAHAFTCKVCETIQSCAYGIADISTGNPNVMFELGMMIALGKPTIILCAKGNEQNFTLPSDAAAVEMLLFSDHVDIEDHLKEIVEKLPPPVRSPSLIDAIEQVLCEINPQLAEWVKDALDDNKREIVDEFMNAIKEAELESIHSSEGTVEIPADIEHRLSRCEEALKGFDRLGVTTDAVLAFYRGNLYYHKSNFEAALKQYDQFLALEPSHPEAFHNRGVIFYELQRFEEALVDYNKALELKPEYPEAFFNRAIILSELQYYEEALADHNRALELRPEYPEAFNSRGITLFAMQRFEEALADYGKALLLRPEYPEALNNRGATLFEMQRYEEALADYDKALELRPDYYKVLNNRGTTLYELHRFKEAFADYQKALELKPDPHKVPQYNMLFLIDREKQGHDRSPEEGD